jgi:hypothetical protein
MKLPTIQRFQKQNYPGSPDWFTRFISDVNSFTEIIWNILNKNVTPSDNMDAQVYQTTLLAGAAASNNTLSFQSTLKHTPQAVIIGAVTDQAAYSGAFSSAVFPTWSFSGTTVSIVGITGLTSGHTYSITFVIL